MPPNRPPQPRLGGFPARNTPPDYFKRPDGPTSAVIVSADGGLLTSWYNVSRRVKSITAVLPDGRRLPATVRGHDPNTDVAYLTVEADGLTPIRWADAPPKVGQFVVAVGCSMHRGDDEPRHPTATLGIVSATKRLRPTAPEGHKQGCALQVSARLNYGNNGGPICTVDGRLLAIAAHCTHDARNTDARKGFNSGVGFSTPAWRLRELLPRLRNGEVLERRATPFMGVGSAPDPKGQGLRITRLVRNSPAVDAGLRVGDVLYICGSIRIESIIDLQFAIQEHDVGDEMEMVVLRGPGRKRVELTITLGARPVPGRRR